MKTKNILLTIAVLAGLLALSPVVWAQSADEMTDTALTEEGASGADTTAAEEEDTLVATATDTEEVPATSGWSLFWRGVRERVSVALTFDPVKKAEKQVQFAEERIKIAEAIADESDDPAVQERAQNMIERANKLMERVEANKEKWLEKKDERAEKLLERAAQQYTIREQVMDKLEANLTPEQLERFEAVKEAAIEGSRRLLNAIENPNISEETRTHLEEIKQRAEEHAAEVKEFRATNRELLQKALEGDEQPREALKAVQEQRVEMRQETKDIVTEAVKARVEARQEVRAERQEIRQETREKIQEIRNGRSGQDDTEENEE